MAKRLVNRALKARRAELGITQRDLAFNLTGISDSRYWKIENGYAEPTESERREIARRLKTTPDELFPPAPEPAEVAR